MSGQYSPGEVLVVGIASGGSPEEPSSSTAAQTSSPEPGRPTMARIAVMNAGSSSIKFALFQVDAEQQLLFGGQIEQIGVAPRLTVKSSDGEEMLRNEWAAKELDHQSATGVILETAISLLGGKPVTGVGHRVVHGGTHFTAPALITRETIASLKSLCPLAPLHQPHNL